MSESQNDLKASLGTTARKRRLMMNEDAACSSVNFARNEFKSSESSQPAHYQSFHGGSIAALKIQDLHNILQAEN